METRCFRVGSYIKDQLIQSFDFTEDKCQEPEKLGLNHTVSFSFFSLRKGLMHPIGSAKPGAFLIQLGPGHPTPCPRLGFRPRNMYAAMEREERSNFL